MMRNKTSLPVALTMICLACLASLLSGCSSLPSWSWLPTYEAPEEKETHSITELWEPAYKPDFDFEPYRGQIEAAEYTIGVVELSFTYESVPPGEWVLTPLEHEHRTDFIDAFSRGLKKALTAKGMDVRGPFPSYDDITFVQRSKCDFIIRPKLHVEFEPDRSTLIEELPDYGGPYGAPNIYGRSDSRLETRARLEYEIIDPRTRKQLERHALEADASAKSYVQLWSQWTMTYGNNSRSGWRVLEYSEQKYPNYHNADNATARALEDLYHGFMPRIESMVTAKEFEFLEGRKRESRKRK